LALMSNVFAGRLAVVKTNSVRAHIAERTCADSGSFAVFFIVERSERMSGMQNFCKNKKII